MSEAAATKPAAIPQKTLRLLGGPSVIVRPRGAPAGGAVALKYAAVENLGAYLDVAPPRVLKLVIANARTAQRRKEQGELTEEESDRLARIARVTRRAVESFGDERKAKAWLLRESRVLGGRAPIELLGTDAGAEAVTDELGRIESGELF